MPLETSFLKYTIRHDRAIMLVWSIIMFLEIFSSLHVYWRCCIFDDFPIFAIEVSRASNFIQQKSEKNIQVSVKSWWNRELLSRHSLLGYVRPEVAFHPGFWHILLNVRNILVYNNEWQCNFQDNLKNVKYMKPLKLLPAFVFSLKCCLHSYIFGASVKPFMRTTI